jgi:hypothetical protein
VKAKYWAEKSGQRLMQTTMEIYISALYYLFTLSTLSVESKFFMRLILPSKKNLASPFIQVYN